MNIKLFLTNLFFFLSLLLVAQKIQITHGPYLQAMTEEGVTIVWTTNKESVSWVEIAPDGNDSFYAQERTPFYDTKHGNRVIDSLHTVRVEGLQPGTTYRYRIFSKEVLGNQGHRIMYGNIASTDVYRKKPFSFTTLNKNKSDITFKMVNDIHNRADMLSNMLRDVKRENTDLVLFNGDMVSTMTNEKVIFDGFMDSVVTLFATEVPIFYARGNHETRGAFSVKFPDYFPTTTNNLYYTFRQGPVQFIVLDGGEDKPDSDIEYSELSQFDAYRTKQQAWLKDIVETAEYKEALYRVVVIHIPPVGSTWHGTQDLQRKFLPILNSADVDIMLCGHTHNYEYIKPNNITSFPILINDNETYLDVKVNQKEMELLVKDPKGTEMHKVVIQK
ncbi:MAG: metallophosphoesterase family protein [Dysgonamonadaceae bacterium]|nr:metallophosphoesterase family protein [Dysgonamonadaceae bacterium]MDD4727188.1 metallophosphoesterase family protein [Dysgonamonadaceae bacterium]